MPQCCWFGDPYHDFLRCDECMLKPDIMVGESIKKILSFMCMFDKLLNRQEKSNEQLCKEMLNINVSVKQISEQINNENNCKQSKSYVDVAKNKCVEAVVIRPKINQRSDVTRSEMSEKLSIPKSVTISGVKNIPKGGVVINCSSHTDLKIIEEEKIMNRFVIRTPKSNQVDEVSEEPTSERFGDNKVAPNTSEKLVGETQTQSSSELVSSSSTTSTSEERTFLPKWKETSNQKENRDR
ncbi:hypothetical protein Bhyg_08007 [Pseudolycoriella hygida]|uniref:Uncharacterized protein n=1 Tax=Pseudolycoriella hygida TaxID=35572 RepID=A0A9Q0N426_9DIPT|nr:hypothetical protein Bhyg_08007 [Pseudolycoriella hygida]